MATLGQYDWISWSENTRVIDSENTELGRVKDAREGYFKVQVDGGFDYWLPFDTIAEAHAEEIRLKVTKAEADERKNDDRAETLTDTEIKEATDDLPHALPVEKRYANEADFLSRPRQP